MLTLLLVGGLLVAQSSPASLALLEGRRILVLEDGAAREVAGSEGAETFAWDADGEHLLVTRAGRLERLDLAGGGARVLAEGWQALRFPDASPVTGSIVCAGTKAGESSEAWKVVLFEPGGGTGRVLCDGYDPCFSRDGGEVWFERHPERDLWRCDLAGAGLARALEPPADRYTVQLDPYGPRVAFSSHGRLVLRELASLVERSTGAPDAYDRFASFAPDRRHVLHFREEVRAGGTFRGICERDLATGAERVLREGPVELAAYRPPTLASFVARAASGLPVDALRDPPLHAWLARETARSASAHLVLPGLAELAPCEAAALARFPGTALFLPDLRRLDAASATVLARSRCSLFLDGLAELDVATARALATWAGNGEQRFLSLDRLSAPSTAVLAELAKCRGWGLSLDGLTQLGAEAAQALAAVQVAWLDLDGVGTLDPAAAEAVSRWHAKFLSLRGWRARAPESETLVRRGCAELITR